MEQTERRPRLLLVERLRYRLPLEPWLVDKFAALDEQLEVRVLACGEASAHARDERFELVPRSRFSRLDGLMFYLRSPRIVGRAVFNFGPDVVMAENPFLGFAALVARAGAGSRRPLIVVEVHGDWRTATRLYGSALRRTLSFVADLVAAAALRRADGVRTVSAFTSDLVTAIRREPPTACFPAFFDLRDFASRPASPLPSRPTALFVGALERYKNVDVLAQTWPAVAHALPSARLVILGTGARADVVYALRRDFPAQVEWEERVDPATVARRMDEATALVLPSRSEGYGRVIVESFARGRCVIGSTAGGIPELIADGVNGILADGREPTALASAVIDVLADKSLAAQLGRGAYGTFIALDTSRATYARNLRRLVEDTLASRPRQHVPHPARHTSDASARCLKTTAHRSAPPAA